jgi:hypothetical protein
VLGEQVNVGIFLFFREDNTIKFIFPSALSRLTALFPDAILSQLKTYLHTFKSKVSTLAKEKELIKELKTEKLISEHLLVPDSNSLFFDTVKTTKYKTVKDALEYFEKKYFAPYHKKEQKEKHSDDYLSKHFSQKLEAKTFGTLFKRDVKISNEYISTSFEFAWKNGHINLVKPLSFDLEQKSSIQDKSVRWYGYVNQLEDVALKNGFVFNFLVAKPRDIDLFETFEKGITIIEKLGDIVNLVYEEAFDEYLDNAQNTISPLELDADKFVLM